MYQVHKFGGASIQDAKHIIQVGEILKSYDTSQLVVVVSAMGKTTNALEDILMLHYKKDPEVMERFEAIKLAHMTICQELMPGREDVLIDINDAFIEIEWMIEDEPESDKNYAYDQIVSVGEIISSKIISHYLNTIGIYNHWLDARDVILTNNRYRAAKVDWVETDKRIHKALENPECKDKLIITQGFIGSTSENFTTTLGREGSDFTAAILSKLLDASKMTVWKDVPGIMTADPKRYPEASFISKIDYIEAIEMTYYGAKVIHPKTIKPLQNKNIPLEVRSYKTPEIPGTLIGNTGLDQYPPILVFLDDQCLLEVRTKDFSYMAEKNLSQIMGALYQHRLKSNMTQTSAISCRMSLDYNEENIQHLVEYLSNDYHINTTTALNLITIRHYDETTLADAKKVGKIMMENLNDRTAQIVTKG